MKVKEESEKVGLKLSIQKTKIMASGPITSWHIDGQTVETVADFILGGSKVTADDDGQGGLACCSPWGCKELDTIEQLNWTLYKINKQQWYIVQYREI